MLQFRWSANQQAVFPFPPNLFLLLSIDFFLISFCAVLHGGKTQTIDGLLFVRGDKPQVPVNLHPKGRRMDGEHLAGIVAAHCLEQPPADPPAVIGRIHEKTANMLGRPHAECAHKLVPIKSSIKGQLANSLLIFKTCPEMGNALLRVLRRFKLQKAFHISLHASCISSACKRRTGYGSRVRVRL